MKRYLPLISTLTMMLVLAVGCTIPRVKDDAAMPTNSSAPTATVVVQTPPTPTEVAQATPAETDASVVGRVLTTTLTVGEVPEIVSYRMKFYLLAEASEITATMQVEGAYIKQPPAEQVALNIEGLGDIQQKFETIWVDGVRYKVEGERWKQVPDFEVEVFGLPPNMPYFAGLERQIEIEVVGTETVNNRSALHYRGGKEQIPFVGPPSDMMFDPARYEWLQLDIWVDETYSALIRYSLQGRISEPPETLTITYDYVDLNSDIQIVAPEMSP